MSEAGGLNNYSDLRELRGLILKSIPIYEMQGDSNIQEININSLLQFSKVLPLCIIFFKYFFIITKYE